MPIPTQFTIDDEKLKEKISDSDREVLTSKVNETIDWLKANELAGVDEFQAKQTEVEGICNPIITKLYQAAEGDDDLMGPNLQPPSSRQSESQVRSMQPFSLHRLELSRYTRIMVYNGHREISLVLAGR